MQVLRAKRKHVTQTFKSYAKICGQIICGLFTSAKGKILDKPRSVRVTAEGY